MARFRWPRYKTKGVARTEGDKLWYLSKINLFVDLDKATLRRLAKVVPMVTVPRGSTITSPSDPSGVLYLLKRGRVRLFKITPDGHEITMAVLGDGNVFGATGAVGLGSPDMYAQAVDSCLVCAMREEDISGLIQKYPKVGLRLIGVLSQRVRELEGLVESLSHESVKGRIMRLLLHLSSDFGVADGEYTRIDVPLTHEDIASMIGSTRETVTATLSELNNVGLVQTGRRKIAIQRAGCEAQLADTQ